jgi:hydrogenase maturation protease
VRTLVIGLGNPVRTDDGVGLAVARAVRERLDGTEGVDVTELWAGGLRLTEAMSGYDCAVIVDALTSGEAAPGAVRRLELSDLKATRNVTSTHDTSLPTALEMWRILGLPLPAHISVWGVEGLDLETLSEELTEPVAAAVPVAAEAILAELRTFEGVPR